MTMPGCFGKGHLVGPAPAGLSPCQPRASVSPSAIRDKRVNSDHLGILDRQTAKAGGSPLGLTKGEEGVAEGEKHYPRPAAALFLASWMASAFARTPFPLDLNHESHSGFVWKRQAILLCSAPHHQEPAAHRALQRLFRRRPRFDFQKSSGDAESDVGRPLSEPAAAEAATAAASSTAAAEPSAAPSEAAAAAIPEATAAIPEATAAAQPGNVPSISDTADAQAAERGRYQGGAQLRGEHAPQQHVLAPQGGRIPSHRVSQK